MRHIVLRAAPIIRRGFDRFLRTWHVYDDVDSADSPGDCVLHGVSSSVADVIRCVDGARGSRGCGATRLSQPDSGIEWQT